MNSNITDLSVSAWTRYYTLLEIQCSRVGKKTGGCSKSVQNNTQHMGCPTQKFGVGKLVSDMSYFIFGRFYCNNRVFQKMREETTQEIEQALLKNLR